MRGLRMSITPVLLGAAVMMPSAVHSQGVKLQAGAGLGYAVPMGDYGGTTVDYYAGTSYGLSGGMNFHAKGRVGAAGFQLGAEIGYSMFSNKGDAEASGQGKVDVSQKVISVKLGPEYMINIPAVPVKPYLGAGLALNIISGETKFSGVSSVPSGSYDVASVTRFGLCIGGGVVYKTGPLMSLDLSVSYNMMNLIGKKYEMLDPVNPPRIDAYLNLNDDNDPIPVDGSGHIIGAARSIHSLQIGLTMMFGI